MWPHELDYLKAGLSDSAPVRFATKLVAGYTIHVGGGRQRPCFEVCIDILLFANLIIYAIEATSCLDFHRNGKTCSLDIVELVINPIVMLEVILKVIGRSWLPLPLFDGSQRHFAISCLSFPQGLEPETTSNRSLTLLTCSSRW